MGESPSKSAGGTTGRGLSWRSRTQVLAWVLAPLCVGCLGEPDVDDRWTRLDVLAPDPVAMIEGETLNVTGAITYRTILTGDVIAELRISDVVGYDAVNLTPEADRMGVLEDVELILSNSQTVESAFFRVTGWDHLIQELQFQFDASALPTDLGAGGMYVILYFGTVDDMELPDGSEVTVIEAADFRESEILPTGVEIRWPEN